MNGEHSNKVEAVSTDDVARDAARYRWLREQSHSLESQHGAGRSCYHIVGGVRELKSGSELDAGVDAAIQQAAKDVETLKHLMLFYSVGRLEDLALAQARHVERLQAKLPPVRDERTYSPREG
jgi:hypothetical protein